MFLYTKNKGDIPLDLARFERLSVIISIPLQLMNNYLKINPYVSILNPCYNLYTEGFFFYVFTLKYMCHFGMSWEKLNLKAKHKIKNKIS